MCGIGGTLQSGVRPSRALLRSMVDAMRLRGPDGEGFFIDDAVGLVHTRLAIRDLSDRGRCPMPNEAGTVQVVFNGEIYNWRELRSELEQAGHPFSSSCDSEVLVHGYDEWGEQLFNRLRGMFAVAIWDSAKQRLVLARDRVGEKPLFYSEQGGAFVFASTIGAVISARREVPPIDSDAIVCYLSHSFIPATHTAFTGLEVFPPAHYGIVDSVGGMRLTRYWDFPDVAPKPTRLRSAEAELERILGDCVQRCLDADVPVGVFLSGGVDSSVVSALAAQRQTGLRSFAIGFEEQENNELPYARRVAEALRLDHTEHILRAVDVIELLPSLVDVYDQPFGDASAVPTYAVSRLARAHVKVCLSGDGGDESFAGYWRAQSVVYASRYATAVPQSARAWLADHPLSILGGPGKRLAALSKLSIGGRAAGYTNSQSWYDSLNKIAGPTLRSALDHDSVTCRVGTRRDFSRTTVLQQALFDDFRVQLPDAYLRKVDVASMAASLEVRAPLLDVELLEFAWRLPDRVKLHWGKRKYLLKRIAAKFVPKEVVYRPKMGFAMPLAQWFRAELGEYLEECMRDSVAVHAGWIEQGVIQDELKQHRAGCNDNHTRLWLILWFELWLRSMSQRQKSLG